MPKKTKISVKEGYKKSKAILRTIEEGEEKDLKKSSYICYDDIIEFPKPVAFTIKRLKEIIKDAERYKGGGMLVGIQLEIPMKNVPKELKKYAKQGRKFVATRTKELK